ncbi:MAG: hypothetical protein AAF519_00885 [Bacteroidota bacterium]
MMESRTRKLPDKINEQYILPVLFLLVNITVVIWFYLVHEYSLSNEGFKTKYRFDELLIAGYKDELKLQLILFSAVLVVTPLYLTYKKRWFLIALTLMHLGVLYDFFYLE